MSEEILGVATNWNVRGVPEGVRKAFVDRAHAEGITIGELLTRIALGGEIPTPKLSIHQAEVVDADRLLKLLQSADMVEKVPLPDAIKSSVRIMVRNELRLMRREEKKTRKQLALPAPWQGA